MYHRRKLLARLTELEDLLEQSRTKILKLEKDKSKFTLEIRDLTIELETVIMAILQVSNLTTSSLILILSLLVSSSAGQLVTVHGKPEALELFNSSTVPVAGQHVQLFSYSVVQVFSWSVLQLVSC